MIKVLLVDDHILFREGLEGLLKAQPDFEVIGQAASVKGSINKSRELKPDLILMDFGLPDGTGLDATRAILADQPEMNIVFLTVHEEDNRLFEAVRSGARGYLLKNVPVARLLDFLRGVIERGEVALTPALTSRILDEFVRLNPHREPMSDEDSMLSHREIEVLQELANGATNREIADRLIIAENTVKNHVHSILTKLNLKNRKEAAHYARQSHHSFNLQQ